MSAAVVEQIGLFVGRPSIYPAIPYFPITTCSGKKRDREGGREGREGIAGKSSRARPLLYHTSSPSLVPPSDLTCRPRPDKTRRPFYWLEREREGSLKRNINHNSLPFGIWPARRRRSLCLPRSSSCGQRLSAFTVGKSRDEHTYLGEKGAHDALLD